MRKNYIVLQENNSDCGAASLLSIIRYYGGDMSLDRLTEITKTTFWKQDIYQKMLTTHCQKLLLRRINGTK